MLTYADDAITDAADMADNYLERIVELLLGVGKASKDLLNDYDDGDSYHHETHVVKEYSLLEAAKLLDELSEHEETDEGLWSGQDPRAAVSVQAAYTYGNAVMANWEILINAINDDTDVSKWLDLDIGEGDWDDVPLVDEKGKEIDEKIAVFFDDNAINPALDYAQENGYKWSAQLAAGYRHEFLEAVKEYMVRTTVKEIIEGFKS